MPDPRKRHPYLLSFLPRRAARALCVSLLPALLGAAQASADECPPLSADQKRDLIAEHVFGGLPSSQEVLVRRGYVTAHDLDRRVPRWAAWRATAEYLDTPKRTGRWSRFRTDPDLPDGVADDDYDGLFARFNFARGHIVPYFISGGDRDGDGADAEIEDEKGLPVEDIDDACTVFEINYMSNIAPQLHNRFNGSGGLWFKLETIVRREILPAGASLNIIAGTVFGDAPVDTVGPRADIQVPHMFYKILISEHGAVPFLFAHGAQLDGKGCVLDAEIESCIVPVGDIEALTGLDFFSELDHAVEARLEAGDGLAIWHLLRSGPSAVFGSPHRP